MLVALATTGVTGKNGVGYLQPDNSVNNETVCEVNPYLGYEYQKELYTTKGSSTIQPDIYTPTRDTIPSCSKKVLNELPPTPKGETDYRTILYIRCIMRTWTS